MRLRATGTTATTTIAATAVLFRIVQNPRLSRRQLRFYSPTTDSEKMTAPPPDNNDGGKSGAAAAAAAAAKKKAAAAGGGKKELKILMLHGMPNFSFYIYIRHRLGFCRSAQETGYR